MANASQQILSQATQRTMFVWGIAALLMIGFFLIFQNILLPFVLGFVVAFLLEPLVAKLSESGLGRTGASIVVTAVFVLFLLGLSTLIVPVLYRELLELVNNIPAYQNRLMEHIDRFNLWLHNNIAPETQQVLSKAVEDNLDGQGDAALNIGRNIGKLLATQLASGWSIVTGLLNIFIVTPFVAFFMMKEWPNFLKWSEDILPRSSKDTVISLAKEINTKLSGFIRGQLIVAGLLGVLYAIALTIAGLDYGILLGLAAGALNIIPLLGSTIGLLAGALLAWLQTGEWSFVLIVCGIFLTGQILEGNFLTPKLVGDNVGLHPLWIFFALLAGGSLMGIVGMLIAIPIAAIAAVLIGFAMRVYKQSGAYLDKDDSRSKDDLKKDSAP